MDTDAPTCPRHPDVETRLRCSSCETSICPRCGIEAAVGYRCPDCVGADHGRPAEGRAAARPSLGRLFGSGDGRDDRARPRPGGAASDGARLPTSIGLRGTVAALVAAMAGGLLLGPILVGGTFFLISSGVIGWAVARAVFWASEERSSPYLRAIALTAAGFAVAIGLVSAGGNAAPAGIAFLAYPAAMYGGWIVVRHR